MTHKLVARISKLFTALLIMLKHST